MRDLAGILRIEVPVIVQIGERMMTVEGVANLIPGAIVELPKGSEEELEILVNNKPVGLGTAVKVGENFGVSVTYVGDLKSRIAAMAGDQPATAAAEPGSEPDAVSESEATTEEVPAEA